MAARKAATDAQPPRLNHGFTLVEIAVVLGIMALVIGALLPLFTAQAANARINATRAHEETIRAALVTWIGRHGYLPCPADGWLAPGNASYGHEARSAVTSLPAGTCDLLSTGKTPVTSQTYSPTSNQAIPSVTIYRGVVPWLDLGLPEDIANDGWNQRITYVVTSLATSGYATRDAITGMLGGLVLCDSTASSSAVLLTSIPGVGNTPCTTPTGASPLISTLSAAVALVSHGENGFGAFIPPGSGGNAGLKPYGGASAAELANIDLTQNVLVAGSYSRTFDDIVLWLTPADLLGPLIQANALPSIQALMNVRFAQAKEAILQTLTSSQYAAAGLPTSSGANTSEIWLCPTMVDPGTHPLFESETSGIAGTLNAAVLPAGLSPKGTTTNPSANWTFAYETSSGTPAASGYGPPADASKAGAPNYDPWGNPLIFSMGLAATQQVITQTTPASSNPASPFVYLLYSLGPDGQAGTLDDTAVWISASELQTAIAARRLLSAAPSATPFACPHS